MTKKDMLIYDTLPPRVRAALQNQPLGFVLAGYVKGLEEEAAVARIRERNWAFCRNIPGVTILWPDS